mmetsp:Transcript_33306/g.87662  ORF Transcript_33306/g.87662 Transcript_33306/m.87662 type:complete len:297 (+) Transcript_33306:134-1024(+)
MTDLTTLDHQVQLRALAVALERVCCLNRDLRSSSPTVFDAVAVPAMSIHCYLVRLHRYTKFDFICFHVATWYLARLCATPEGSAYCPTLHNIHRLLIAALLVASKATDDIFHANVFMAQCGGISVGELNKLEVDLCDRLQWKLLPTIGELRELVEALPCPQASFWATWYNARAAPALADSEGEGVAAPSGGRLPQAKSVADSLGRLFRGGTAGGASDGNLQALADKAATLQQQQLGQLHATQQHQQGGASGGSGLRSSPGHEQVAGKTVDANEDGSPRSVVQRTFSLSNLFGLASW